MKRNRRLEVVVETTRRVTLRKHGPTPAPLCKLCSGALIPAELAVAVTCLNSRTIHRLVEAGDFHFDETPAAALPVCPDSLRGGAAKAEAELSH